MTDISAWLLLRGLSRESRQWGSFPKVLAAMPPKPRVERLDLPGIGQARDRKGPSSIDGMVDDLRERFQRLTNEHKGGWGILGISLGGMVAMNWTYRFRQDFKAAVVINSSAANLAPLTHRLRPANLPTLLRAARAKDPVKRELIVLGMNTSRHGDNLSIATEWAGYQSEQPPRGGVVARQLLAGLLFRAPPELGVPTLFVSGANDRFVSPRCTTRLAAKYHAPHEQHPEAGHDLTLDEPEWLSSQIGDFVSALQPEAAL